MLHFFAEAVQQYGYLAVALLVAVESMGVPLPGETAIVAAAGFAAARGSLTATGVAIAATIGTVIGGSGGYWIGRLGGRSLLVRHGHWIRLDAERIARMERWFRTHGLLTVFFARFVALLRIFGSLLAGVAHMNFVAFSVVNLLGGALWAVAFSALGYTFGKNLELLEERLLIVSLIVAAMVGVGIAAYLLRRRRSAGMEAIRAV